MSRKKEDIETKSSFLTHRVFHIPCPIYQHVLLILLQNTPLVHTLSLFLVLQPLFEVLSYLPRQLQQFLNWCSCSPCCLSSFHPQHDSHSDHPPCKSNHVTHSLLKTFRFSFCYLLLFIITKKQKQPKFSSTDVWINKMWSIHAMEYYSDSKRNEVQTITWMNPETFC